MQDTTAVRIGMFPEDVLALVGATELSSAKVLWDLTCRFALQTTFWLPEWFQGGARGSPTQVFWLGSPLGLCFGLGCDKVGWASTSRGRWILSQTSLTIPLLSWSLGVLLVRIPVFPGILIFIGGTGLPAPSSAIQLFGHVAHIPMSPSVSSFPHNCFKQV